ncbi:YlqD family protein [Salirhabdus salicampi]|uniref:YlqD family protein n=1 Tax=Salirhabdus salicampi TaxID=476102 RepID=UPI0020C2F47E|nr:YlqD family protein [Salirhabdus salicampi]MCP8616545.1 YlqD family protein [Salirhabdus salicampi]
MKFLRTTTVKQVITEKSKEHIREKFEKQHSRLENECSQLRFEMRKLRRKKGISPTDVDKRFQKEIDRRQNRMKWIEYQLEQLDILPIGSEIIEDEVEEMVEVEIGNKWQDVTGSRSVIVKDGIVIRIETAGDEL